MQDVTAGRDKYASGRDMTVIKVSRDGDVKVLVNDEITGKDIDPTADKDQG